MYSLSFIKSFYVEIVKRSVKDGIVFIANKSLNFLFPYTQKPDDLYQRAPNVPHVPIIVGNLYVIPQKEFYCLYGDFEGYPDFNIYRKDFNKNDAAVMVLCEKRISSAFSNYYVKILTNNQVWWIANSALRPIDSPIDLISINE